MCCSMHPGQVTGPHASPVRALHSLSPAQVLALRTGLRRMPGLWAIDEQEGYDGDLTLLLTPEGDPALSFALWRTPAGLHLSTMLEDDQLSTEVFGSIGEILLAIAGRRVFWPAA
jgi:hypothetical protein